MAVTDSTHAAEAVARMKGIALAHAAEARAVRRRYAADLAQHDLDPRAFDAAVQAADAEYRRFYRPRAFYDQTDREEMHTDAQLAAYERLIGTYLTEAGR